MSEVPANLGIAISRSGTADIDLYTDPALAATNTLALAAQTFASQWPGILARIQQGEAALSGATVAGDLATARVRENLNLALPAMIEACNGLAAVYGNASTAGRSHVVNYLETDGHDVPAVLRAATQAWA